MWDNYYDSVVYEEKLNELDNSGHVVYKKPREIQCRMVSGGKDYIIQKDGTAIKYTKEYQIPFMINENDKINSRLVLSAEASKDVFGNFHFCIAKVE